jgi:hypothetical protein
MDKFEIKLINGRNYRVYKEINPIFFQDTSIISHIEENKEKYEKMEKNDDVDSYSGDSEFLKSDSEEDKNNINVINGEIKDDDDEKTLKNN